MMEGHPPTRLLTQIQELKHQMELRDNVIVIDKVIMDIQEAEISELKEENQRLTMELEEAQNGLKEVSEAGVNLAKIISG